MILLPGESDGTISRSEKFIPAVLISAVVLTPLVFSLSAKDAFRLPKEIFVRAEFIVVAALVLLAWIHNGSARRNRGRRDPAIIVAGGILIWTLVSAIASTNRGISSASVVRTTAFVLLFVTTVAFANRFTARVYLAVLVPAVLNSTIFLLQYFSIWNPFASAEAIRKFAEPSGRSVVSVAHDYSTALIGNRNDVGAYLALAAVVLLAFCTAPSHRRLIFAVPLLVLCVLLTGSIAAIAALVSGGVTLAILLSPRRAVLTFGTAVLVGAAAIALYQPAAIRMFSVTGEIRNGRHPSIANRLAPFASAVAMGLDHPLTGVGPGCFAFQYFDYRQLVEARFPPLLESGEVGVNFGEVHNDHLQVFAELGVPGLLLLWGALAVLTTRSLGKRQEPVDDRMGIARYMAAPLAVAFAVLAMGNFPLELAATAHVLVFAAAIVVGWTS